MASQNSSRHYTLETLTDGVYAAIAKDGGAAISNAGLVDLGDSTLVIDTFLTPTAAEDLRIDAQRLTGRDVRWVVDTHYHNDHIWGNQAFVPEAQIISTFQTRALIETAGKEEYDDYRAVTDDKLKAALAQQAAAKTDAERAASEMWVGFFSGLSRDFPRLRVTLPTMLFESHMLLRGSKRRAELIAFSAAHTASDAIVYLPDDGIVFMSDLLFAGYHPYLGDGNPDGWLEALRSVLDGTAGIHEASHYVPGHGLVATAADVHRLMEYVQDCKDIARKLGENEAPDVGATPIPEKYASWKLPRFFYANLNFLLKRYLQAGTKSEESVPKRESHSFRP